MNIGKDVKKAVELLARGDVVGIPTETVYGLAAAIDRPDAVKKIFAIKERPFFDPLIVHVHSLSQAKELASEWLPLTQVLAETFWPGPMTLVVPKKSLVNPMITSGLETVGIRWPKHALTEKIIQQLGVPLAAPSANKFGRTSPTSAEHVLREFDQKVAVVDGGACEVGLESTVLRPSSTKIEILRPGAITKEALEVMLRKTGFSDVTVAAANSNASPGSLEHHYMPAIPVILWDSSSAATEAEADIGKNLQLKLTECEELSLGEDAALAARNLYERLRQIEASQAKAILIRKYPHQMGGYWTAIWDRVGRAAKLKI